MTIYTLDCSNADIDGSDTALSEKDIDTQKLAGNTIKACDYISNDPDASVLTFTDGSTLSFSQIENIIPCFTPGVGIATPKGERRVEDLKVGDRVVTRDNGIQRLVWVGQKEMTADVLRTSPRLHPIEIKAGALGDGLPERDMFVSPNHRMLIVSDQAKEYFGESEVLVAAKHMIEMPGIQLHQSNAVNYIHFMFENHEIVLSDGAWSESFQPGDYSLKGIDDGQREEIFTIFPELATREGLKGYRAARRSLKQREASTLKK